MRHYPDVGSDASLIWDSCARFSDVISKGNQWWNHEMSAVFSGYNNENFKFHTIAPPEQQAVLRGHQ